MFFIPVLIALTTKASTTTPQSPALVNACTPLTDPTQIPSPTVIDFDELPDGEVIGSFYQTSHGVIFENSGEQRVAATASVLAHSGFNVATNQPVPPNVSNNLPLVIQFESLQTHVGFYVGNSGGSNITANLIAFNANGVEVCAYDMEPVPDQHTLFMGVYDPAGSIDWVMLNYGDTEIVESIDDLYISTAIPTPTATFTPTPTNTATATPTPSQTPTPTATPIPITDLVADDLEITQEIQNLDNNILLIAGKRTFVRFYAHSSGGDYLTTARLRVQKGTAVTYVYPIAPGGPYLKVRPYHLRLLPGHAFLFELPSGFRDGSVFITAELNFIDSAWRPSPNPKETNYANNFMSRGLLFSQAPTLPVVVASQPYISKATGIEYWPTATDQWMLYSWLKRAYPVNKVNLYLRTLPMWQNASRKWVPDPNDPSKGSFSLTNPNCNALNSYLSLNKAAIINTWFYHKNIHLVGLVSDEYGFMRGCAWGESASGPAGNGSWGWDSDGTYADWYGAHELGHTYGRSHTLGELPNGCGEKGTVKQHPNGYISASADIFDRQAIYGFDSFYLKTNPILGPIWHDVMTYCDKQWVSDITFKGLYARFALLYGSSNMVTAVPAQSTQITDRLAVFGAVNLQTGQISTLLPMSVWFSADDIEPRTPGAYAIVLLDSGQNELARYPFSLDSGHSGASPLGEAEPAYGGISELIPYVNGTTQVNIEGPGGALLTSVSAGLAAPTVTLLSPNGGEILSQDSITVSWTAVDADNDPLFFNLYHSPDNGGRWNPVALAITGTQIAAPNSSLVSSSSGLFRIEASDGIHTANDTSNAVFTVPNHLPEVTIFTPDQDVTIAISQTLALEAFAYDVELGLMDDTLAWHSSLDGALGNGAQLSTASLSAGVHLITALADDGQGGVASDNITVTVVATLDDLPSTPDALLIAPNAITLYSMGGVVTTTMGIDNQNPVNDIPWQATADKAWLSVNITSGTTFTVLTLLADAAGLEPGTHEAVLTFSRPDGGGPDTAVPVTLIIKPYTIFLPTISR
ncbi:MAG: hypothetical protein H6654_08115 [Ardenticatenaceae bacterium]|nr:hypothetical protein [Ardenticatenaceae bacterium]MCB8973507.1 hypothetical protein [Ardenticatenaceae bacterium]